VERGYRVVPPVDTPPSLTFQAWRGTSAVSVIGVAAVAPLQTVIEAVRKLVDQLAPHERVEGCVVLSSNDAQEREQVLRAGLIAVPHKELARMGVREITAFVDRQQAALAGEEAGLAMGEADGELCRDLRAALRESNVRVVLVRTPSVPDSARRIVLDLTRDYLRDPARAAPLCLRFGTRQSDFQELVACAFDERRVPFSRFDFPGLLSENAFLPVFAADSLQSLMSSEGADNAAVQALAKGAKVVLVTSEEGTVTLEQLARRWNLRTRKVRTLPARTSQTKRPRPFVAPPGKDGGGVVKGPASARFEQGRALLVGVANYARISRLPELVLDDARDIASLLHSPTRCGYPESNVELLLDGQATAERFRRGLQRLANEARVDDTVVIFFSGHGVRRGTGSAAEAYLLPFDYDPDDLARTALSANELTRLLADIRASRLVVLFDACHAAGAAYVKAGDSTAVLKSGLDDRTYDLLGRGTGRVVMASSRADESSLVLPGMKNSLFTAYLLEALSGDAANQDEDVVRVFDVFHHISQKFATETRQHPILKAQDVENNFPIALNLKTKQASLPRNDERHGRSHSNGHATSSLTPMARLAIKKALIKRWDDLADYLGIPLADKVKFAQGYEGQRILEWLEERDRLHDLREAFDHFNWNDLLAVLDRQSR
jgi:metacaspase-1